MEVSNRINSSNIPVTVIQMPEGRLNAANAQSIAKQLTERLNDLELFKMLGDSPNAIVLDLSRLSFVDSIGIGTLISFAKRCGNQGWTLKLSGLQAQAKAAFEILELSQMFEFYDSVDEALEDVNHQNA